MTLYMVTSGEYSDYGVCGIYSTFEKAEYAKKFFCADNAIETLLLDDLPGHPHGTFLYCVVMDREGNTADVSMTNPTATHGGYGMKVRPYCDEVHIEFRMWAKDEEHAVKIANEYRTGLLSKNLWPADDKSWNELVKNGLIESWVMGK